MVILGKIITGTLKKRGDEFSIELVGNYDSSIKDAIIKLLPSIIELFDTDYSLTVELIAEEIKVKTTTTST